jgi:hypothetical protein
MKKRSTRSILTAFAGAAGFTALAAILMSSSHREAPLIADDPLADNTDVYAFRSPTNPNKVVLIANYIPFQLPDGGPNYYHFGENIRYEIHVDNNTGTPGDDVTYRWTFTRTNQDPTTFFNIRNAGMGPKENLKTTYTLERIKGSTTTTIVTNGVVPPYNVGPRSITSPVGLGAPSYESLLQAAITTASTGERVFAGPVDDPFFVDAGGIFDLGDAPRTTGSKPQDVLRYKNVSTLALEVDISTLQKDGKTAGQAANILDGDFVIGVWASASRRKMRVLNGDGTESHTGDWVQVSRLGMPLTNEVVIPIGFKDKWNSMTPYQDLAALSTYGDFFYNPELALYMDDTKFGGAVPALKPLRIQRNSLGAFGFGNGQNGLYPLKGNAALAGSALDDAIFGTLLLPAANKPRSVDLWPIFHTGVPNLKPYQLATGKMGNPLADGKPFINNFLPNGGDMLRLNMAVPVTPRNSPDFNSLGLVWTAVLGLTDPRFNMNANLQPIPNMDGFPNGRRLEDDVTRIELQAVSGIVLAAIGLYYDDFIPARLQAIMEVNSGTAATISGYTLVGTFGGHTYYKSVAKQTWPEASAMAMASGGYLVTITSMAENDFVFNNGVKDPSVPVGAFDRGIWIGLNDAMTEGRFVWANGEAVSYTNWEPGEPNNFPPGEDFGTMLPWDGKWNDYFNGDGITPQLLNVLTYQTGINRNDTTFKTAFPFVQAPWSGTYNWDCNNMSQLQARTVPGGLTMRKASRGGSSLGLAAPEVILNATPNPVINRTRISYNISSPGAIQVVVSDANGRVLNVLVNAKQQAGTYNLDWDASGVTKGFYFVTITKNGVVQQTVRVLKG